MKIDLDTGAHGAEECRMDERERVLRAWADVAVADARAAREAARAARRRRTRRYAAIRAAFAAAVATPAKAAAAAAKAARAREAAEAAEAAYVEAKAARAAMRAARDAAWLASRDTVVAAQDAAREAAHEAAMARDAAREAVESRYSHVAGVYEPRNGGWKLIAWSHHRSARAAESAARRYRRRLVRDGSSTGGALSWGAWWARLDGGDLVGVVRVG